MGKIFKFIVLILVCIGQTSCFILTSSTQSSSSEQVSTNNTKNIAQKLTKRWRGLQVYKTAGGEMYDNYGATSCWMQFYSDGTCYEHGFLGTNGNQQLRWSLNNNQLTIRGRNLTFADGNLSGQEVKYDVVSISDKELHLSRWDGQKQNGTTITRHIILQY